MIEGGAQMVDREGCSQSAVVAARGLGDDLRGRKTRKWERRELIAQRSGSLQRGEGRDLRERERDRPLGGRFGRCSEEDVEERSEESAATSVKSRWEKEKTRRTWRMLLRVPR